MRRWQVLSLILIGAAGGAIPARSVARRAAAKPHPAPRAGTRGARSAGTAAHRLDVRGLTLMVPASWHRQPATTPFRLAQYAIPHAPGEPAPAQFVIFFFGPGQGGSAEANIQRWIGMMRQPNGRDSHTVARLGQIQRPGLRISTLNVTGTYLESPNPFTTETIPRPHSHMLAAVVETTKPNHPESYYLRLVGPSRSVSTAKAGWDAMLASMRVR